jgi:hypothetical protein
MDVFSLKSELLVGCEATLPFEVKGSRIIPFQARANAAEPTALIREPFAMCNSNSALSQISACRLRNYPWIFLSEQLSWRISQLYAS